MKIIQIKWLFEMHISLLSFIKFLIHFREQKSKDYKWCIND